MKKLTYVSLEYWTRKDVHCSVSPWGARNIYLVVRETEKAYYVNPVDTYPNEQDEQFCFWVSKKFAERIPTLGYQE